MVQAQARRTRPRARHLTVLSTIESPLETRIVRSGIERLRLNDDNEHILANPGAIWAMSKMIETARSSVQTWECDQMGHMNVQFYMAKEAEGMATLASALGLRTRSEVNAHAVLVPREQHIRFHRELRPGAPFIVQGGVLQAKSEGVVLYQEMNNAATSSLSATFVTYAEWSDLEYRTGLPLPVVAVSKSTAYTTELPAHGAARGLELVPPRPAPLLSEAQDMGLITTFQGCVQDEHCDRYGYMHTRCYMGRVSDAIPNLIAQTTGRDRSTPDVGGAALEYRFLYRTQARAGDLLMIKSGLKSVSAKTYVWCHWLFDAESGQCFATAEAVAVSLDLRERKAIEIPPALRSRLEGLIVPDISI